MFFSQKCLFIFLTIENYSLLYTHSLGFNFWTARWCCLNTYYIIIFKSYYHNVKSKVKIWIYPRGNADLLHVPGDINCRKKSASFLHLICCFLLMKLIKPTAVILKLIKGKLIRIFFIYGRDVERGVR